MRCLLVVILLLGCAGCYTTGSYYPSYNSSYSSSPPPPPIFSSNPYENSCNKEKSPFADGFEAGFKGYGGGGIESGGKKKGSYKWNTWTNSWDYYEY